MKSGLLPFQLHGLKIQSLEESLRSHPTPPPALVQPRRAGQRTLLPPEEGCFIAFAEEDPTPLRLLIAMPAAFSGSFPLASLLLGSLSLAALLKWRSDWLSSHQRRAWTLFLVILGSI